jgi:hypothetical protein
MKLAVTVDLEDIWQDDDTLANDIRGQIKYSIEAAVRKEVNAAVKGVLADQHEEIKEAARKYGKLVLAELLKK